MPKICTDDGINLFYEEASTGAPMMFVHEFAGDYRSWEPQIRHFSRRYRCITYSARGYPPSDVPERPEHYSQDRVRSTFSRSSTPLELQRRTSWGVRWVPSPPSISAWNTALLPPRREPCP